MAENNVKSIDITKSSDSDTFFSVYATISNDDRKNRLIIINNDKFLYDLETLQRSTVRPF